MSTELTEAEREVLVDAHNHAVDANCFRFDCEDGVIFAVTRIVAARVEAAWDEGYATALGDFDIAARREVRSPNPYRGDA